MRALRSLHWSASVLASLARWGEAAGSSGSSGLSLLVPSAEERARGDEAGARRARGRGDGAHSSSGRLLRGRSADGPPRRARKMRH